MLTRTVIAIPSSFDKKQNLETISTNKYVEYLEKHGAGTLMTTAGTSNFNLLSTQEIHNFNESVSNFGGTKIIGIPPLNQNESINFAKEASRYIDNKTSLMALFPDRYYDDHSIIQYMSKIRDQTENSIYIHAKPLRKATGGTWNYTSDIINILFERKIIKGIKEEHLELASSYDFVANLNKELDVIVAGGSMRRHRFLESAGANAFLSGIGNLFPEIEQDYLSGNIDQPLVKEHKLFSVFMKYGWHKSLRIALKILDLSCYYDRDPWPMSHKNEISEIETVIEEISL